MSGQTITKERLSRAIAETLARDPEIWGISPSRQDSRKILDDVLSHISDALARGEDVKISSFGSFLLREKSARLGRNPRKPEETHPISPRRVLKFRPSTQTKERVRTGNRNRD